MSSATLHAAATCSIKEAVNDTDQDFIIEIAGRDVTLETVPTVEAMQLAANYLELLRHLATEYEAGLSFHGLRLAEGSARLVCRASVPPDFPDIAEEADGYVRGTQPAPPGLRTYVERTRGSVRQLGTDRWANVIVGPWSKRIEIEPSPGVPHFEILNLRVRLIRVGGEQPRARFRVADTTPSYAFSLDIAGGPPSAREMGKNLYGEFDIVADAELGEDGRVRSGKLLEYYAVEDGSGVEAWREWFQQHCANWNQVEDVLAKLGRKGRG